MKPITHTTHKQAKVLELRRAQRVYERQSMGKKNKQKPSTVRAFSMHQLRDLSDKIDAFGGIDAAAAWYATTPLVRVKYPDKAAAINYAKCTIRSLLKPDEPHNQVARDQLALLMRDLGKPQGEETVRVVSSVVEVEATEAGTFLFDGKQVRTTGTPEAPLFCAADVCGILGIGNPSDACARLDDDEKTRIVSTESGGIPRTYVYVTEPGLYALIGPSRKPEARRFQRWVNHEVLPAIRKTGHYETRALAAPLVDPTSAILVFMREQQAATERANERRDALLLEGLKGLLTAAKPAPQNDPAPPVATTHAPRRAQEPKPTRQERFRFPVNRRMGLVKKIKAQIPADVEDYSKTIRTLWHGLYAEMERHGVSVLASVADYQLLHGEQIDYLDWIEQNGHLELAIRCAFALWPERKTAA